jgi:hypothetical protein
MTILINMANIASTHRRLITMVTRKLAGVLLAVLIVVGFVGIFIVIPAVSTTFHYSAQLGESETRNIGVTLIDLDDTNVSVTFIDSPSLWFQMDVVQYTPGLGHQTETLRLGTHNSLIVRGSSRIMSIDLVLGSDAYYSLTILGDNVNVTIIMDNGATISGQEYLFSATGIFRFRMTEDVSFTTDGLRIGADSSGIPSLILLDIDLPDSMNGDLEAPDVTFVHNEWTTNYSNHWTTPSTEQPLLRIDIPNTPVIAILFS